jgi:hypothetical protein
VRLSTESSTPINEDNLRPGPLQVTRSAGKLSTYITSGFATYYNGGDYLGMAATADGAFHPIWSDARHGAYEMMTARITVDAPPVPIPATLETRNITDKVMMDYDPSRYDLPKGEMMIPIRIRNVSRDTLYGPFTIEVTGWSSRHDPPDAKTTILNSSNGKGGVGATMDYSGALRDLLVLPPGGVTEALVWRVKPGRKRATTVSLDAAVRGRVKRGSK